MLNFGFFFAEVQPYKDLFDEGRWQNLVQQFRQENYRLLQLPAQTVFSVALQAGLSALKTPYPFHMTCFLNIQIIRCQFW